jgi:trk system potassium uptake protein TrkA
MLEYVALDENFVIVETIVPAEYVGRTLGTSDIRAKHRVTVVCIKPEGGSFTYAERDSALGANDLIVLAGHRDDVEKFTSRSWKR